MGYTLDSKGNQQWDGKYDNAKPNSSANSQAQKASYDKWVGSQTNTNYSFDPNNYQIDSNGARYTPGYSAPVTTKAVFNPTANYPVSTSSIATSSGGGNGSNDYSKNSGTYNALSSSPTGTTQQSQSPSITSQLEQLKKAQLAQTMAGLDKQKNSSLSNLSAEKATIEPLYQKGKTQASVTAKQTARSFDEYMAQRGGTNSGIAGQGALLNNMAYQKQYGELDQAEKSALSDVARRETDVNNAYASDVQGANAGVEAQYLQNYITQMNSDRQYGLQKQQIDNQASQFAQSFGLSQQQLANTIAQQGIDNAYRDRAFAQAADQFAQQMGLSRDQYKSSLDQWAKSYDLSVNQYNSGLDQWSKSFEQSVNQNNIQNSQWDKTFNAGQTQQQFQNQLAMQQLEIQRQNAARAAASKSISQSSYEGKTNQDDAIIAVQEQLASGNSPGNIARAIEEQREALKRQGINVDKLIRDVWDSAGVITKPGEL